MPASEFSEDQFEYELIDEFRNSYGFGLIHFKPTRPLEYHLGFDFAIHTNYPRLRRRGEFINRIMPFPLEVLREVPRVFASSFIQCKTVYNVTRKNAANEDAFEKWRGPYYQFEIDDVQHSRLLSLEKACNRDALVRYSAPCFSKWEELQGYSFLKIISDKSQFVSPGRIGSHKKYSFRHPLQKGYGLSEPEEIEPESYWDDLFSIFQNGAEAMNYFEYIERLWNKMLDSDIRNEIDSMNKPNYDNLNEFKYFDNYYYSESRTSRNKISTAIKKLLTMERYFSTHKIRWSMIGAY